ncbi:Cell division cycle protein 48 homolog MJ1156 [Methanocaldococcus jannaschii DSM 2661] [Rhizoctonia solani]|uniref:Cell division cycle protein 48 homolog MJ1156 [Methanocaldococcus jannaschii DSM 2661] n=1 Tax=Rhizoctonia solani TaxID=456999 RepID=A0A0K6GD59_9AGAM|nr:Cell division cycle protein 48 homolog MJ1156 [Methanocaldococcus jannaschii DSM 2661] [Rhizoctonia solani]
MAECFNADIQMFDLLQFAVDQWSQGWTNVIKSKEDWIMSAGRGYFWRRTDPEADKLKRLAHQLFSQKSPDSEESKSRRRIIYIRDAGIVATLTPALYSAILEVVQKTLPGSNEWIEDPIPTAIVLGTSPFLTKSSLFQKGSTDESDCSSSADKKSDPWSEADNAQAEREKRNQKQYKSLKDATLINHVDSDLSSTDLFANMKSAATSRYRYSRICVTVPMTRNLTRERAVREKIRIHANLLQLRMALRFKAVEQSVGSDDTQEMVRVFKERCQNSFLTIDDMRPIYERAIEVATGKATIQDPSFLLTWDALINAREAQDAIDQERSEWVDNSLSKSEEEENTTDPLVEKVKEMELNSYETGLLQRIIKPGQLKTTFDSVHLPDETIDVVRSVVSLPLICPEAFQTGLLKEHNVTGALFFGPPGTGKTNLARAIAKESGSRMISVKPSDIYNKWCGESEKIVSGLFSLARKLKPCIIFMDEIDSLFGSRDANVHSPWRNDLLTQFAQEMDGMYSSDVIVIGTTNRPFSLDDAMLRRLPCRILIDLPDEAAREAILKILLKNEQIEDDVDIKDLAKQTQRYSGSDLKNLCVMAAYESAKEMAKVPWATSKPQGDTSVSDRSPLTEPLPPSPPDSDEESTASATEDEPAIPAVKESQQGTEPNTSKSRIIRKRHFTYAITKVQASTSESQTSFIQLRKWNDQFGSANQKKKVPIEIPRLSPPVVDRLGYLRNSS